MQCLRLESVVSSSARKRLKLPLLPLLPLCRRHYRRTPGWSVLIKRSCHSSLSIPNKWSCHENRTKTSATITARAGLSQEEVRKNYNCILPATSASGLKRYAVLGAGFAGVAVAWHLLQHSTRASPVVVDLIDAVGIGAGASGIAGGLLHPFSRKGKVLWKGEESWEAALELLAAAEAAHQAPPLEGTGDDEQEGPVAWHSGILRPVTDPRHATDFIKALWKACQTYAENALQHGCEGTAATLHVRQLTALSELHAEGYDALVVCLGAAASQMQELNGHLPLTPARGKVLELSTSSGSNACAQGAPSLVGATWVAFQGSNRALIGATKEKGVEDMRPGVGAQEAASAIEELLPRASALFPPIGGWKVDAVRAGVRAMTPRNALGSLPIAGRLDEVDAIREVRATHLKTQQPLGDISDNFGSFQPAWWIVGGLGSRGLIYHGWLAKASAAAIISGDESFIDKNLTMWKTKS
eukprot:jgi/Mesen1/2964/ME000176S01998